MKVYIVRHAQAMHNLTNNTFLFDPELTDVGKDMCVQRKEHMPKVQVVLSSTSTRALQTAHLMFPEHKIYASHLFLEHNTGAACNIPSPLAKWEENTDIDIVAFHVPSLSLERNLYDVQLRVEQALDLLRTKVKANYDSIAIVSHGNFIDSILQYLGKYPGHQLDNCEMIELEL